ncbi:AI-2E family transporter, partial [Acinetobacter sp. RIT592]
IILEKESFISFSKKTMHVLIGEKRTSFILEVGNSLNENIGKYFAGKILDSFIVGVISGVGLYLIGSPYALLFGTLIGFMNMIPYFGPVIGMTPVVLINLFYNPSVALFSLVYLILVQQVEIAFIEPKIVGGQLGLSPFFTILAVTVGGGFFGIPGMILSAPLMGVLKIYLVNFINHKYNSTL